MSRDRPLSSWERLLLLRLLEPAFPGRDELLAQVAVARCWPIDQAGSIQIDAEGAVKAPVVRRIPTEGEATDDDGVAIHFLLHVVGGFAKELEVYKDDSSPIRRRPAPDEVRVMILN